MTYTEQQNGWEEERYSLQERLIKAEVSAAEAWKAYDNLKAEMEALGAELKRKEKSERLGGSKLKPMTFQIEDIDGCEFVRSTRLGKMLISWHRDFDGYETGKVHVVYPDASHRVVTVEEAQRKIDIGEWIIFRLASQETE